MASRRRWPVATWDWGGVLYSRRVTMAPQASLRAFRLRRWIRAARHDRRTGTGTLSCRSPDAACSGCQGRSSRKIRTLIARKPRSVRSIPSSGRPRTVASVCADRLHASSSYRRANKVPHHRRNRSEERLRNRAWQMRRASPGPCIQGAARAGMCVRLIVKSDDWRLGRTTRDRRPCTMDAGRTPGVVRASWREAFSPACEQDSGGRAEAIVAARTSGRTLDWRGKRRSRRRSRQLGRWSFSYGVWTFD
jgi:hypothetical protein